MSKSANIFIASVWLLSGMGNYQHYSFAEKAKAQVTAGFKFFAFFNTHCPDIKAYLVMVCLFPKHPINFYSDALISQSGTVEIK